jgi:hypothetical protein
MEDLVKRLEAVARLAEAADFWTDDERLMPAAGVADVIYEAMDRLAELEAREVEQ